ncbi:MAG TPA: hypothetical protein VLI90_12850, partial [Tepidisphaeraceae bacterium]|nr:hypothetical protein [Tepidisphaeraceae bacterium]
TEAYFPNVPTPIDLPRQDLRAVCPAGIVRITIDCIVRNTGGIASFFGFEGFYLRLLVSVPQQIIWDARGEEAT